MATQTYQSIAASDLSASATTAETLTAPKAGVLRLDESYIRAGEIVTAASTTAGIVYVLVGGVTVSSTTPSSTTLTAIGKTQTLTADDDKYIEFDAGDDIVMSHAQAVGATITGTTYFHLSVEWGV